MNAPECHVLDVDPCATRNLCHFSAVTITLLAHSLPPNDAPEKYYAIWHGSWSLHLILCSEDVNLVKKILNNFVLTKQIHSPIVVLSD